MTPDPRIREYYDERYSRDGVEAFPPDAARYEQWLRPLLGGTHSGTAVLDYGCGVGHVSSLLVEHGFQVHGVDISAAAIDRASGREPSAEFLVLPPDGTLPFPPERFDAVVCLGVLEHIREPGAALAELRRVVTRGGLGIWVVPNALSPFFWFGHGTGQIEEHPRTEAQWRRLLAAHDWRVDAVHRDPGPLDRPMAVWKRAVQRLLNSLPTSLTYQFILEARAL